MHARVSTLQLDADRIDDTVKQLEDEDLPKIQELDGFKGFTLLVDRASGKLIGTTYWESKEQMDAADAAGTEARERAAKAGGASGAPQVERFEVAVDTMA
jgi:heme-degrading monooxygenase HmoA